MRRSLLAAVTAVALAGLVAAETPPGVETQRSLAWLRGQIVPNDFVPAPDPQRRGLILSYAPAGERAAPLHRKAFVYDAGLAAIALTLGGDPAGASRILQALVRVQRQDGSFWFSYNVDNRWPDEADHDMALVRAGATAWAGYALGVYLERRPEPEDARGRRERALLLAAARRAGEFVLGLRAAEPTLARGLVRGGRALIRLTLEPDGRTVREVYEDRPLLWASTEHNVSSYFLLTSLARLTGEARYAAAAREIRERLLGSLWQEDLGQFAQGVLEDGRLDRTRALDCASWGALFLLAAGETEKAGRAARAADAVYRSVDRGIAGHRPYHDKPIYEDPRVQRLLLPDAPDALWKDLGFVWGEGSLGIALALGRLGEPGRARAIVGEVLKLRAGDGLRLASRELPYEFTAAPSVATTAWHVIVEASLRDDRTPGVWSR
jgi:hypothetical protein